MGVQVQVLSPAIKQHKDFVDQTQVLFFALAVVGAQRGRQSSLMGAD
jgi:hypothetical protein